MPLNRPALALGTGPRGVQDARRWVSQVCADLERPELTECAQLGVSELVTNALLHGESPIEVRVRGTREHPRIEVRDASAEPPVMPQPAPELDLDDLDALERGEGDLEALGDLDDLLLTFGRGLSIVARASDAWGADLEADGKTVWFSPAADFSDGDGALGVLTGGSASATPPPPVVDPVTVRILGLPLRAYTGFDRHLRELRREVRLLALAHESAYPLAKDLSDLFGSLERHLRGVMSTAEAQLARAQRREVTDLTVETSRATTQSLARFNDLLDLADDFCREERLLSLARTPEQRRFQRWLLGEFVRQGNGEDPLPWTEPVPAEQRRCVVS